MPTDLAEDGLHLAKLYDYDIILYDVAPSEIEGYKMLHHLRAAQVDMPILILSGVSELDQIPEPSVDDQPIWRH